MELTEKLHLFKKGFIKVFDSSINLCVMTNMGVRLRGFGGRFQGEELRRSGTIENLDAEEFLCYGPQIYQRGTALLLTTTFPFNFRRKKKLVSLGSFTFTLNLRLFG